jgi:murein DD-endopeptidase MepM/ murein hydrolase activator NlpD
MLTKICMSFTWYFVLGFGTLLIGDSFAAPIEMKVNSPAQGQFYVLLKNTLRVPLVVTLTLRDGETDVELRSARLTSPPLSSYEHVFKLDENERNPKRWVVNYKYQIGFPVEVQPDLELLYPIEPEVESTICQSDDGPLSTHTKGDYAIDICAPLGSKLLASHDGIVLAVETSKTEGGTDPRFKTAGGNYLVLIHESGLRTYYGHLAPNSSEYIAGDFVRRGAPIGKVGLTGFTAGPHVHFQATYMDQQLVERNINPRFINADGVPVRIRAYNQVISGVDYDTARLIPLQEIRLMSGQRYNKYKFGVSSRWFEYSGDDKVRNRFFEAKSDQKFYYLKEINGRFGLAIPKVGGVVFLLDEQGRFRQPYYQTESEGSISKDAVSPWLVSFEAEKELLRRYEIESEVFWTFSSRDRRSGHEIFREVQNTSANYVLEGRRLMLKIPKKGGKTLFSRDGGAKWFDYKLFTIR